MPILGICGSKHPAQSTASHARRDGDRLTATKTISAPAGAIGGRNAPERSVCPTTLADSRGLVTPHADPSPAHRHGAARHRTTPPVCSLAPWGLMRLLCSLVGPRTTLRPKLTTYSSPAKPSPTATSGFGGRGIPSLDASLPPGNREGFIGFRGGSSLHPNPTCFHRQERLVAGGGKLRGASRYAARFRWLRPRMVNFRSSAMPLSISRRACTAW
jgi:hypothetical protein